MKKAAIPFLFALICVMFAAVVIWPERRYIAYVALQAEEDPALAWESASAEVLDSRFYSRFSTLQREASKTSAVRQMIETLKLYTEEWKSLPMEDLVERCKNETSATPTRGFEGKKQGLRITYRHRDRKVARLAADYIAGQYLALNIKQSHKDAQIYIEHLHRRASAAEEQWTDGRETFARNPPADPDKRRRAALDIEMAHQLYLKVLSDLSVTSARPAFSVNELGPKLAVIDSGMEAPTPEFPWWPALGWGAGCGFALGLFILCLPILLRITWKQATFALASSALCTAIAWLVLESMVPYQSTATLRILASNATVPPPILTDFPTRGWMGRIRGTVTSTSNLTNLIANYDLGKPGSAIGNIFREPVFLLCARFQKLIEIGVNEQTQILTISYRDRNRRVAQKITEEITNRMIAEALRTQSENASHVKGFLEEEVGAAATEWTRAVHQMTGNPERVALDVDLARKRYIELKTKLATATMVNARWSKSDSKPASNAELIPHLQLEEAANLPEDRESLNDSICWACAFAGFMIGLVCASRWQGLAGLRMG